MPNGEAPTTDPMLLGLTGDADERGLGTGDLALGIDLFDPNTGDPLGRLVEASVRGQPEVFLLPAGGDYWRDLQPFRGGMFLTSLGRLITVGGEGQVTESRSIPSSQFFGDGGGGAAGLTFGERQALAGEERAFEREQAQEQRGHEMRLQRISEAMDLTGTLAQMQQQARMGIAESFETQPFRAAALAQGRVPMGRSPTEAYREQLRGLTEFQAPALGAEPTGEQASAYSAQVRPVVTGGMPEPFPMGMAEGGEVGLEPGVAVLTGERGPEVVEMTREGTLRFIPLAGSAQYGGTLDPFQMQFDPSSVAQPLVPAWQRAGLGFVPIGTRAGEEAPLRLARGTGMGLPQPSPWTAETFGQLGVRPRFFRTDGQFLYMEPGGQVRTVGTEERARQLGFNPGFAVQMSPAEIRAMGGTAEGLPSPLERPPLFEEEYEPFAQRAFPTFMPTDISGQTGFVLPEPRKLASLYRTLDPSTQELMLDAWEFAGRDRAEVFREMRFFTPPGTAATTAALR